MSNKNLFSFPSYSPEYCYCISSHHRGSAILVLANVKYKRRDDLNLNVVDCESVWVELDHGSFCIIDKYTIVGSIYRSLGSSVSNFCLELERLLHSLSSENKNVIITGYININLLDDTCAQVKEYVNCFHGFLKANQVFLFYAFAIYIQK